MSRITNIMIGVVLVSLILTSMMLFMSEGVNKYSPEGYNDTAMTRITESFKNISDTAEETQEKIDQVSGDDKNIFDRIGAFFSGGYVAGKTVADSYSTLDTMTDVAIDETVGVGGFGATLKSTIPVIMLIIIFIGIILHFLIKSDRL